MKTFDEIIGELDDSQRDAARIGTNAVIAAGAGSGKTRVLAARYLHLVVERGMPVDEILALTFTRKAAAEMYARINATLRDTDHPNAREAVENFHLARIDTIDAFCNSVARSACRRYGIAPDFEIDNDRARDLAEEMALPFFIERRASPAIRQLMKRYSLAELPGRLFADTMVRHSPISSPPDFAAWFERQRAETSRLFDSTLDELYRTAAALGNCGDGAKMLETIREILVNVPERPERNDRKGITDILAFGSRLAGVSLAGNTKKDNVNEAKEQIRAYRDTLHPKLLSLANFILNEDIVKETFSLLAEFRDLFNASKRERGILTFTDVSRMAVDALRDDPDLRAGYKDSVSAIMIDEFQDDNALQRDLLFLIAERPDRREPTVPGPEDLCPDKLFFVGDEKQSIYRFRGADVAVFRSLSGDLGAAKMPVLGTNYRTETPLLELFNLIFPRVFRDPEGFPDSRLPPYEAGFSPIGTSRDTAALDPSLDAVLVAKSRSGDGGEEALSPAETEAAEVASRIVELIASGYPVRGDDGARPVEADDIAILFRSGGHQHLFEYYLREFGIAYQTENLRGLFADAPVNDIYALLRLAVFPSDSTAYAMLLRSPLVGIGDEGFARALLARTAEEEAGTGPFDESAEEGMSEADRAQFTRGRALYLDIQKDADRVPIAELVSRVWYGAGYRYSLLTEPALERYASLYDYFFELARQADARGETLASFLDRMAALMDSDEKIEGLDIPVERSGGVHLMTVHKSKGLEFPVVFLADAGSAGRSNPNPDPVFFSGDAGLSVNTGGPDDAEDARSNWFYEACKEEERKKEEAELRRLLYVAMTRAETKLILSAVIDDKRGDQDDGAAGESRDPGTSGPDNDAREILVAALAKKLETADKNRKEVSTRSFLDLLLEPLSTLESDRFRLTVIPPMTRAEVMERMGGGTAKHASITGKASSRKGGKSTGFYGLENYPEDIPVATYLPSARTRYSATSLPPAEARDGEIPGGQAPDKEPTSGASGAETALDRLLSAENLSATDFGTLVHQAIEARFEGREISAPDSLKPALSGMVEGFFSSDLGKLAKTADWRRTEYGFITRYPMDGRALTVTGQIDLAFEADGIVHVVDYKTDRREEPALHADQLAVYRKALGDLRKKTVKSWLFYLRTGRAVPVE